MDWDSIERWDYIVTAVASEYHRKFSMVELEDIRQSLYQWFAEHPNKLKDWESIGDKDAKNLIYHYYDSEIVEALLPPVLRGEYGVTHKLNLGFTGRPSAPAEGGNLTIMMLEIDSGYWKLSKDDRRIIFLRFAENLDFGEIANYLELGTDSAARMRLKRAITRLINKIGGYKPYRDVDTTSEEPEEEHQPPVE